MSGTQTPAPPRPPDVDPLEALIKEARRRARRRRALYGASALLAAGSVVAGFYGFSGGGGHARASAPTPLPHQTRSAPTPRRVKNGPLAVIDGMNPTRMELIGPRGRHFRSLPICRPPRCGELTSVTWSPDGQTLVYGTASGANWHPQDGLHLFNLARNKDRRVNPGDGTWQDFAWSADGKKLAYVSDADIEIIRMSQPQRPREFRASATSPSWSPNGRLIAYDRFNGRDTRGIYVSRLDGSNVRRLSKWGHEPVWSPDGRLIAYSVRCGIRLMTPAGKDVTPVSAWNCLHIGFPGTPTWSPDGRKLAFGGAGGVYVMNVDGSGLSRIWKRPALRPAWQPVLR
jgi:hypothetical protein